MKSGLHKTALWAGLFASVLTVAQSNPVSPPMSPDPDEIIKFLSKIVAWHRQITVEQPIAQTSDLATVAENRVAADQVVQLGFEYARSQAPIQAKGPAASQPLADAGGQSQRLAQAMQRADKELQDTEAELQSVRDKLATARPSQKNLLQSTVAELQSEISLLRARRDALQSMVEFVNSSNSGGGSLRTRIDELARSLPQALTRGPDSN